MVGNIDNLGLGLGFGNVFALTEGVLEPAAGILEPGVFEVGTLEAGSLDAATLETGIIDDLLEETFVAGAFKVEVVLEGTLERRTMKGETFFPAVSSLTGGSSTSV